MLRLQARTRGVGWGRTLSKGSGTKLLLLFRACHHAVPSISAELLGFAAAAMTLASFVPHPHDHPPRAWIVFFCRAGYLLPTRHSAIVGGGRVPIT